MDHSLKSGMRSIRTIYKIGRGPSSSHTMGPEKAALVFLSLYPEADRYRVELFGSLSSTGEGHGTHRILRETLGEDRTDVIFCSPDISVPHPNTMTLYAYQGDTCLGSRTVYSIGGGDILWEGESAVAEPITYPHSTFRDIANYCLQENIRLWEYVERFEDPDFPEFLRAVWGTMTDAIHRGLLADGELPGGLHVQRKAKMLTFPKDNESPTVREDRMICSFAFAISEENAAGGRIVTAPTCGACGAMPAALYYLLGRDNLSWETIRHGLETAGLIGNLIRTNASISGAECGCQAEIGSACSMTAAAIAEMNGMTIHQIEYAAEIAMEHHLGLTCDPICGLVQIPCIERNGVAAMRAMNAVHLASFLSDSRKISFDLVVETMEETGKDLSHLYRETSKGGLAKLYFLLGNDPK